MLNSANQKIININVVLKLKIKRGENKMMWVLHIVSLLVFPLALFITIPFHILISMQKGKQ